MSSNRYLPSPEQLLGFSLPPRGPHGLSAHTARHVARSLAEASIPLDAIEHLLEFKPKDYVRVELFRTPDWQGLLLGWSPGSCSTIHDHGISWGVTKVLRGEIREESFVWRGVGTSLARRRDRRLVPPGITTESLRTIHRVSNDSQLPAISLHLYSAPMDWLRDYFEDGTWKRRDLGPVRAPEAADETATSFLTAV